MHSIVRHRRLALAVLVAIQALPISSGLAQSLYWDTNGSAAGSSDAGGAPGLWEASTANWSSAANGTAATVAWTPAAAAIFAAGENTDAYIVTVTDDAPLAASGLTFQDPNVTLDGGSLLDVATIDVAASSIATILTVLDDSVPETPVALTKTGDGTLSLGGLNTFSGGLTISAGEVIATADGALGLGSISIISGASLQTTPALLLTQDLTVSGPGSTFVANESVTTSSPERRDIVVEDGAIAIFSGGLASSSELDQFVVLTVRDAGSSALINGDLSFGNAEGATSSVEVLDGSFLFVENNLLVNNAPDLGENVVEGQVLVSGTNSLLQVGGNLSIGNGDSTRNRLALDSRSLANVVGVIDIGFGDFTESELTIEDATLVTGSDLFVADGFFSEGYVTVSGADALLEVGRDFDLGYGELSTTQLLVNQGAIATVTGTLDVGFGDLSDSEFQVTNGAYLFAEEAYLGAGDDSTVAMLIAGGGVVEIATSLHVGDGAGAFEGLPEDLLSIDQDALLADVEPQAIIGVTGTDSSLTVGEDLFMSYGDGSISGLAISDNASVSIAGDLSTAYGESSVNALGVGGAGSSLLIEGDLISGSGLGSVGVTGALESGTLTILGNALLGEGVGSLTVLTANGAGSLAQITGSLALAIGEGSVSGISVEDGAEFEILGQFTDVAIGTSSIAGIQVLGIGSSLYLDELYLGFGTQSISTLDIETGGYLLSEGVASIGFGEASLAAVAVSGPGSFWEIESRLAMGAGADSESILHISDGGIVAIFDHLELAADATSIAEVEVADGGTLAVTGINAIRAGLGSYAFTLSGGTLYTAEPETSSAIDITLAAATDSTIATLDLTTLSGVIDGDGALTKDGLGDLVLTAANTYTGGTTIADGAVHAANTEGSALGTGSVTVQSGAFLLGAGNIDGPVFVLAGGSLTPGDFLTDGDYGVLTVGSGTEIAGMLEFYLAGTDRGVSHTALDVSGDGVLTLDGAILALAFDGFFTANLGDSFDVLDFDAILGTFSSSVLPDLEAGLAWDMSELYTTGTVSVALASAIPEPSAFAALAGLAVLGLASSRRRR